MSLNIITNEKIESKDLERIKKLKVICRNASPSFSAFNKEAILKKTINYFSKYAPKDAEMGLLAMDYSTPNSSILQYGYGNCLFYKIK